VWVVKLGRMLVLDLEEHHSYCLTITHEAGITRYEEYCLNMQKAIHILYPYIYFSL